MSFEILCAGRVIPFSGATMLVGRSAACDVALTGHRISRKHARLRIEDGAVVVEDLGSSNGVLVNGERVQGPHRLADGDVVHIGEHELRTRPIADEPPEISALEASGGYDDDDEEFSVGEITVVDSQVAMAFEAAQLAVKADNPAAAEAVLGPGLRVVHRAAIEGDPVSVDDVSYCVRGACLLARCRNKVEWLKLAVDIQLAAKERVAGDVAADLDKTARELDAIAELDRLK